MFFTKKITIINTSSNFFIDDSFFEATNYVLLISLLPSIYLFSNDSNFHTVSVILEVIANERTKCLELGLKNKKKKSYNYLHSS